MSNISNNTAAAVLAAAADKAAKVKDAREVTQDVSSVVLKDAIAAVKETDSANYAFATSLTAMCIDALSRKVARQVEFKPGQNGKVSPTINASNTEVLFALMVRATYLGQPVFLNTKAHVSEIAAMPNGRRVDGKDDFQRAAKIKAAREYVDGTWTLNGHMLPLNVDPTKDTSGNYIGATRKAMVSSFATARKMSAFLVAWFWNNRSDVLREFNGRALNADDVKMIRSIIGDAFGETFAELESAYKLGRPAPKPRADLIERVQKSVEKATLAEITALAAFFDAKRSQMVAAAADAAAATGMDNLGDFDIGFDDEAEAIAA